MNALDVWCPQCGAPVGTTCMRVNRADSQREPAKPLWDKPHQRRVDIADGYVLGWNAGVKAAGRAIRKVANR